MTSRRENTDEKTSNLSDGGQFLWVSYVLAFLILVLYFVLSMKNIIGTAERNTFYIIKILVSLSIGLLSTLLTGFIEVLIKKKLPYEFSIKATQGFAVALLVFMFWPKSDLPTWDYQVTELLDEVDFKNWQPFSENDTCSKSVVHRTVQMKIKKNHTTTKPFNELFGTTNISCKLSYMPLQNGFTIDEDEEPVLAPRITYSVKANSSYFINDTGSVGYLITYYNNFDLLNKKSNKNEVSKKFPYFVKSYHIRLIFDEHFKWKQIRLKYTVPAEQDGVFINTQNSALFEHTLQNVEAGTWISYFIEF